MGTPHFRAMTAVLGRRQTLKYLTLGAIGAATATLASACGNDNNDDLDTGSEPAGAGTSVTGQTIAAFITGTWNITSPLDTDQDPLTVTVGDGTWTSTRRDGEQGTWVIRNGWLQVTWAPEPDADPADDVDKASVTGLPERIEEGTIPPVLAWEYNPDGTSPTAMNVPATWDPSTNTLSMTGVDANGAQLLIEATRA